MTTSDDTFRLLYEAAVATSGVLEPERLARLAVEQACRLTGADSAFLFWWVPERELLILLAEHPLGARPRMCTRKRDQGVVGMAFDTGQPQVAHDYATWPSALAAAVQGGVAAAMAVPLVAGGRQVGALCVRSYRTERWLDRQIEALDLLARLVAPALAAAREHADLEAAEESFRAVFADAQEQLLALVREFSLHRTDAGAGGEPVSMSEHQALMELSTGEELSQSALAMRLRLEKSTISRLAAQMESRGWLERNRDTADLRLVRLRLTPRGQTLARDLAAYRASKLQGMLQAVPPADRESVVQALKLVVRALQRTPEGGASAAG
ncbi:MAG TPA: GAF domain-containing protein [Candidatus Dormibacteraeota bacterium]